MRILSSILILLAALPAFGQSVWRNFFTTNHNPLVTVVAGSNATVQASTVGSDQRIFTVNAVPTAAGTVYGSNVVGAVSEAVHATNSDLATAVSGVLTNQVQGSNVLGSVSQAAHATNADLATSVSGVLTNQVQGSNVLGSVSQAAHATNADISVSSTYVLTATLTNLIYGSNVVGSVSEATHATNADTATTANALASSATLTRAQVTNALTGTITNNTTGSAATANTATNAAAAKFSISDPAGTGTNQLYLSAGSAHFSFYMPGNGLVYWEGNSPIGDASGLTNLNASELRSGTVADARLSANVALDGTANPFTASNSFAGGLGAITATFWGDSNKTNYWWLDATGLHGTNSSGNWFLLSNGKLTIGPTNAAAAATVDGVAGTMTATTFIGAVTGHASSDVATTTTITVAGTANQVTSSAGAQDLSANRTWTLSLPSPTLFPGNVSVAGLTNTGIEQVQTFDSPTNTWTKDAAIFCGTNAFFTSGATTCGITAVGNLPASTERYGQLTVIATGTITFTNIAAIHASDYQTSRTITNANTCVIGIDVIPGQCTNMAIVQFK